MTFILIAYYVLYVIQACLGHGTAYRLTKRGGDNGVSLFGWLWLMTLAAAIPGLGIWLWRKYREEEQNGGQYDLEGERDWRKL